MGCSKKFIVFFGVFVIFSSTFSQTVKVKKETARVKGENLAGFEVELTGKPADVEESFSKFLKALGKGKQTDNVITLAEPTVGGKKYTFPVYGVTKDKGNTAAAWIGLKDSEWPKDESGKVIPELEKLIKEFGVKFYRDQIQLQIDESTRASQAVEKQQQRLVTENKSLTTKLEDNKREKIQLDKSLQANVVENGSLLKKLEKNKHDQDSVAVAGEQIKKVVEMHKERQRKVN
jgi:hypothetical protein